MNPSGGKLCTATARPESDLPYTAYFGRVERPVDGFARSAKMGNEKNEWS